MLFLLPLLLWPATATATDQQLQKGLLENGCIRVCNMTNNACLNSCVSGPLGLPCQGECAVKFGVCEGLCIGLFPRKEEKLGKLQFCMKTFGRPYPLPVDRTVVSTKQCKQKERKAWVRLGRPDCYTSPNTPTLKHI